jgi:hypothetical protein
MKHYFYFILLIVSISSCGNSCNKDKDKYEEVVFEFVIPLTISPGSDTVNVGQELTLIANFPDSLFDIISQKKYYLANFNFKTVAVINKLTNPSVRIIEQPGAVFNFNYNNITGSLSNLSTTFADINFLYQNNMYKLEIKIKPNATGVYSIHFYHSTGTSGQTKLPSELAPSIPGVKRFPIMRMARYIINSGNTHLNIYEANCLNLIQEPSQKELLRNSSYTFVVK